AGDISIHVTASCWNASNQDRRAVRRKHPPAADGAKHPSLDWPRLRGSADPDLALRRVAGLAAYERVGGAEPRRRSNKLGLWPRANVILEQARWTTGGSGRQDKRNAGIPHG